MRPIRTIATALLIASLTVAGCARSQREEAPAPADQPPAATATPGQGPRPHDRADHPPAGRAA